MFPAENSHFNNVTYVDAVPNDRDASLTRMRLEMLKSHAFEAAVFIGGMEGVFEELAVFQRLHPNASIIPIASAGGAALEISQNLQSSLTNPDPSIDYIGIFHNSLKIAPDEPRQATARI